MARLLIKLIDYIPSGATEGTCDDAGGVFCLSRSNWRALRRIEPQFGFFNKLKKSTQMECGKCGSFTLQCRDFFYALIPSPESVLGFDCPQYGLSDEAYYSLHDNLWTLLNFMTEEKITSTDEWRKLQDSQMPEKNLLYTLSGGLIFPEEGYPLGLLFEEAFFKVSELCESCDDYIC